MKNRIGKYYIKFDERPQRQSRRDNVMLILMRKVGSALQALSIMKDMLYDLEEQVEDLTKKVESQEVPEQAKEKDA